MSEIRSRVATDEYRENFAGLNWHDADQSPARVRRARYTPDGFTCGLAGHAHETFGDAVCWVEAR